MAITTIEWCDYTWSPWEGCTKVSPGCVNCYAEANDQRHLFEPVDHWGPGAPRRLTKDWNKPAKLARTAICRICGKAWPARGMHPDCDGESGDFRRARIFPSICDWLDAEVPSAWLARFLQAIHNTPNLDWMLLTKRPENFRARMEAANAEMIPGTDVSKMINRWLGSTYPGLSFPARAPINVWIGTSVEDQQRADERIPALLRIPARKRFLSVEPLLGSVSITFDDLSDGMIVEKMHPIDWVIVGGESGRNARPCNIDWVQSIVHQCSTAGVPCFVKQLGLRPIASERELWDRAGQPDGWKPGPGWVPMKIQHPKGGDPAEWPEDLRVRQFPEESGRA
ncbi:MAG: DUF5131 family protein [Fimbriimonadaceae bacterium]|nr:DUF5131 family protein [Fimbriimonadaceae bacterium]